MSNYNTGLVDALLLEHKRMTSEIDIKAFKSAGGLISEGVGDIMYKLISDNKKPEMYCDYVSQATFDLTNTVQNTEELLDFYTKVYKSTAIGQRDMVIPLRLDDGVERIRPEYFMTLANTFDSVIQKIISGNLSEGDIMKIYVNSSFFINIKRQLVKSTINGSDFRTISIKNTPPMNFKVDNVFIMSNVIPFLKEYPQNVKNLGEHSASVRMAIRKVNKMMQSTISVALATQGLSDNQKRAINCAIYNFYRHFLDCSAYTCAMLIRKITCLSGNMVSYNELYNNIITMFPDGELVLHESVINGDLSDIDDSTLLNSMISGGFKIVIPHIQAIVGKKKMEISNIITKKYNHKPMFNMFDSDDIYGTEAMKHPYDFYAYASVNKTLKDIANSLKTFGTLVSQLGNGEMIVDDIIENSGLNDTFLSKYESILSDLPIVSNYYSDEDEECTKMYCIYNEVIHFESNVEVISRNVGRIYDLIQQMKDDYFNDESVINVLDTNVRDELISFIESVENHYKDYVLRVAKQLLLRLTNLTDMIDDSSIIDNTAEPEEFVPYDYSIESFEENFKDILEIESFIYESVMRLYNAKRQYNNRGVHVIYEDEQQVDADSSHASVNTDASKQNAENGADEKDNNDNTSNDANAKNKNNKNGAKEKLSLIERFRKFIDGILEKFRQKSSKITAKNNTWIDDVEKNIMNLDYSNTTISLAPYPDVESEKLNTRIANAINKINGINAAHLPNELRKSGSDNDARAYLFGDIPKGGKSFTDTIKNFLIWGKADGSGKKLTQYSGDDAKTKVDEILGFCKSYSEIYKNISNNLENLSNAAAKKQTDIINSMGAGDINADGEPGATTEASEDPKVKVGRTNATSTDDEQDKLKASNVITATSRDYVTSILTVVEKKYLDYIRVLSQLAPKRKKGPDDGKENNDDNK